MSDRLPEGGFAALVPELDVSDLDASLSFWCGLVGFRVAYARPEAQFAYLESDGAQVMLNVTNGNWATGSLESPFGRGINFQLSVRSLAPILTRFAAANWPLFCPVHDAWYRIGDQETCLRKCLVQDPDGYLLRLAENLGIRRLNPDAPAYGP